jgi:segregation and condensation protein A
MEAKKVPWWRRALDYALGGIRTGFGLFSRPAQPDPVEPVEESSFFDRPNESLEVETELKDQPNPKTLPAAAEPVAPPTPAAKPVSAQASGVKLQPSDPIAPVDAVDAIDLLGPVESNGTAAAQPVEAAVETPLVVSSTPLNELPVAAAIEPSPAPEPETAPPTEPEDEPNPQPEHEEEPVAEISAAADPLPAAEPTPSEEPLATDEPDPLPEQRVEPVLEVIETESDLIEPLPDEPEAVAAAEQPVAAPEPAPLSDPASPIAPATETPAAETTEPAPVAETTPAPTPKPFIKLESRDDEANLSPFSVVVDQVYDGPLDLLLDLIRKQDIDIYDIPIAKITAQFLAYVNQLKASDVDVAGEFIYIASLLIHIKSKMLLPRSPAGPEEAVEDPRRELVERLLEHERFKNAAQMLQQKQMLEAATWTNPGFREFQDDVAAEPEIAADTVDLVRIFRDILERVRSRPVFDVDEDAVTVGQMIQFLTRRLTMEDKPVALRRLLSHTRSERALIAIFLALLELVRLQAILLRQDRHFSEIFVKKHTGFDAVMNEGLANAQDDWK